MCHDGELHHHPLQNTPHKNYPSTYKRLFKRQQQVLHHMWAMATPYHGNQHPQPPALQLCTGLHGFNRLVISIVQFLSVAPHYKDTVTPPLSNVLDVHATRSITWVPMTSVHFPTPKSANKDLWEQPFCAATQVSKQAKTNGWHHRKSKHPCGDKGVQ